MMRASFSYFMIGGLLLLFTTILACKPKKLENGRAIAEEVERRTVKRFTEKQILAEAKRFGDSLTYFADSLLQVRVPGSLAQGGLAAAIKKYPPEKYPEVKAFADKYAAHLQRRKSETTGGNLKAAQVKNDSQTEILYTKPIFLNQEYCLTCHGPAVANADKQLLLQHFPDFNATGYSAGEQIGEWYLPIARKGILENLTLRGMKKQRPRSEKQ